MSTWQQGPREAKTLALTGIWRVNQLINTKSKGPRSGPVTVETAFLPGSPCRDFFSKAFTQMELAMQRFWDRRTLYFKVFEDSGLQRSMLTQATGRSFGKNTKRVSSVHTSLGSYFKKPRLVWLSQKNSPKGAFHDTAFYVECLALHMW